MNLVIGALGYAKALLALAVVVAGIAAGGARAEVLRVVTLENGQEVSVLDENGTKKYDILSPDGTIGEVPSGGIFQSSDKAGLADIIYMTLADERSNNPVSDPIQARIRNAINQSIQDSGADSASGGSGGSSGSSGGGSGSQGPGGSGSG